MLPTQDFDTDRAVDGSEQPQIDRTDPSDMHISSQSSWKDPKGLFSRRT